MKGDDATHPMIAINRYGPHKDLDEARQHSRYDYTHCLYIAIGKCRSQRAGSLRYFGIERPSTPD
jgi:hypothetical protein